MKEHVSDILAVVVAGLIGWLGWMTRMVLARPDRTETRQMVKDHSPYNADQGMIREQLDQLTRQGEHIAETQTNCHDMLHRLEIMVERLRTLIENNQRPKS